LSKIKKNFKAGNIILHTVSVGNDIYENSNDGERKFVRKDVSYHEETLLIVGHAEKYFIVAPLGECMHFGDRRKYFNYGGFPNCFRMLTTYVNQSCLLVS